MPFASTYQIGFSKKAHSMAEDLMNELKQRTQTLALALSYDTDQYPLVRVGSGVVGEAGALIKFSPINDWVNAYDIIGHQEQVHNPHMIQVCFEAQSGGTDPNTWAEKLLVLATVLSRGTRVMVYESANGDSPDADDFIAAKLKATYEPSTVWGLANSQ